MLCTFWRNPKMQCCVCANDSYRSWLCVSTLCNASVLPFCSREVTVVGLSVAARSTSTKPSHGLIKQITATDSEPRESRTHVAFSRSSPPMRTLWAPRQDWPSGRLRGVVFSPRPDRWAWPVEFPRLRWAWPGELPRLRRVSPPT